ncbi:MAG: MFS transporter [Chloroflexi bacterium]|nr:MFS transporter [Chloroflexota bacterium]MCC6893189.1 MFS transporter [Anaerolineae bacterium]
MAESAPRHDTYAALRLPDFRLLIGGRLIAQVGEMMVSVAVSWELYERTSNAFLLGMVGLVQVLPVLLFSLPAGYIVDRYNRKNITLITQVILILCSLLLAFLSITKAPLVAIFVVLAIIGTARAFNNPAEGALTPLVVPEKLYHNAVTWSSSTWQAAAIFGPAVGGFIIALSNAAAAVYVINAISGMALVTALLLIRPRQQSYVSQDETPVQALKAGLRFLRNNRIILSAISLDMFAVLLGGATYLLPVFTKDILHVDATGLGLLRAAPSVGALGMALFVARRPPFQKAGATLLWAVAGFGVATIIFGLSTSFWLSLVMMVIMGALDNISVVIRHTLSLVFTPDDMRGRVGAVNSMFIGASNELGGFESGVAAALLGPVGAVVFGGLGTIAVVGAIAAYAPELRRMGQIRVEQEALQPDAVAIPIAE